MSKSEKCGHQEATIPLSVPPVAACSVNKYKEDKKGRCASARNRVRIAVMGVMGSTVRFDGVDSIQFTWRAMFQLAGFSVGVRWPGCGPDSRG
jgi:hypothetical protein